MSGMAQAVYIYIRGSWSRRTGRYNDFLRTTQVCLVFGIISNFNRLTNAIGTGFWFSSRQSPLNKFVSKEIISSNLLSEKYFHIRRHLDAQSDRLYKRLKNPSNWDVPSISSYVLIKIVCDSNLYITQIYCALSI